MATVVYQPRDTRWAELGSAINTAGVGLIEGFKDKKKKDATAAAMGEIAEGKISPEQASARLFQAGMNADEVNKALSGAFEDRRQQKNLDVQTRGQDLQHEDNQGNLSARQREIDAQLRGQDVQKGIAEGQLKLGYTEISAANKRSQAEIDAREKLQGQQLSAAEQAQIRQHNYDLENAALRAKQERDNTILQGAINSQLGKENTTGRISEILASGNVQAWLQNDAQQQQTSENAKDRDLQKRLELVKQEGDNARLDRSLMAQDTINIRNTKSAEKINSDNIRASQIDRTVTEAGLRSRLNSELAHDTFKSIQGQLFTEKMTGKQQDFQAAEGDKNRQNNLDVAAERAAKATQAERNTSDTANMLAAAADSLGVKIDPSSDKGKYLAKEYNSSSKKILDSYTKQLGIDSKTMTPDGFMTKFDGSKVGGLDRMKLEVGSKMLPKLYVQEAGKDSPNITQGNIQSQLMAQVDEAMKNPANVLPPDFLDGAGNLKVKPGDAVKYLVETKGFTKEDVRRWSSIIGAPLNDEMLNGIYPWSN